MKEPVEQAELDREAREWRHENEQKYHGHIFGYVVNFEVDRLLTAYTSDLRSQLAAAQEEVKRLTAERISIEVYQHDFIPGWAAFHDDGSINPDAKAHVVLNVGLMLAAVNEGVLDRRDLPYMIAESLCHEVIHTLEAWAGVEFNEDRVEELLTKYREKYQRDTIWEYKAE